MCAANPTQASTTGCLAPCYGRAAQANHQIRATHRALDVAVGARVKHDSTDDTSNARRVTQLGFGPYERVHNRM